MSHPQQGMTQFKRVNSIWFFRTICYIKLVQQRSPGSLCLPLPLPFPATAPFLASSLIWWPQTQLFPYDVLDSIFRQYAARRQLSFPFSLSLRRKPWMLKGTLCSGEKPQQFVLWFLDKSMCTPSVALSPSWGAFNFFLVWGFLCLLFLVCCWVFLLLGCVCVILKPSINPNLSSVPSGLFGPVLLRVSCRSSELMLLEEYKLKQLYANRSQLRSICCSNCESSTENVEILILIPPLWPSSSWSFSPIFACVFYDLLSKVLQSHRKGTPESEGKPRGLVSFENQAAISDNSHIHIFFSLQSYCVNLLSHQGTEHRTRYLIGNQERSCFPGPAVAHVLLCFSPFYTCASSDIQSADFWMFLVSPFTVKLVMQPESGELRILLGGTISDR